MRIWLIAENWPPKIGGIENYLSNIADHLPEGSVTVFAPPGSTDKHRATVVPRSFFWPFVRPSWAPFFLYLVLQAYFKKPDVILCGKALVEGRIARLLNRMFGIPYIVCTYGMEIATWSSSAQTKQQLEHVLQEASRVLYINEKTKNELLSLGVHKKNLFPLYPGITPSALLEMNPPQEVLKKYSLTAPYILTVARLVKRKGIDDLIQAFSTLHAQRFSNLTLAIVGDGPERISLEHQANDISARIRFLGSVPDKDLHALYATALLFALTPKELPGDYEGFGIVFLEASFFSLPVLGTKTGGVSEAVQDGSTGILANPGNIASISASLQKLLDTPTIAKQYGEAGRARVVRRFEWNTIVSTFMQLLKDMGV